MKKKFIILLLVVALLPTKVFAKSLIDDYNKTNLKETVEAEGFELENKNYKETDDQVTIYLFRGQGCSHCHEFVEFLNSISTEYGKYFKLVAFEVWYDNNNKSLFSKIASFKGDSPNSIGVPYFIIGDKVFNQGYGSSMAEEVKKAIMDEYKNPTSDVMEEYEDSLKPASSTSSFATVFWNAVFIAVGAGVIIYFNNRNTNKVLEALGNKKETKKK